MAEPASRIGRYEIVREIGRGAMGVVYEARDPALDRTVALKVIQPDRRGRPARIAEERFLAEARIAARLQHPGIVVVHDVGIDPASGSMFIALELLRGETLADLGEGPRRLAHGDVGSSRRWRAPSTTRTSRASSTATSSRPTSSCLPSGEAKVMDFGIARLESARQRLTIEGGVHRHAPLHRARAGEPRGGGRPGRRLLPGLGRLHAPHRAAPPSSPRPSRGSSTASSTRIPSPRRATSPASRPTSSACWPARWRRTRRDGIPSAEAFAEDAEDVLAGRPRATRAPTTSWWWRSRTRRSPPCSTRARQAPASAAADPCRTPRRRPVLAPPPPPRGGASGRRWSPPFSSACWPSSCGSRAGRRPLRPTRRRRSAPRRLRRARRRPRPGAARSPPVSGPARPAADRLRLPVPQRHPARLRRRRAGPRAGTDRPAAQEGARLQEPLGLASARSSRSRPAFTRCGSRCAGRTTPGRSASSAASGREPRTASRRASAGSAATSTSSGSEAP